MTEAVRAYVAVGSNIEPEHHIPLAMALLRERVKVTAASTFYWTAPVGSTGQPAFLNGMVRVETAMPPRDLKCGVLREVERLVGRVRTEDKYAPRSIDLDLVLHGDVEAKEDGLVLPDPELQRRAFLAVPLLELEPTCRLPGTEIALAECPAAAVAQDMTPAPDITETVRKALGL